MDEKNEKVVKNGFSQARRSYGEERGLVQRWLPAGGAVLVAVLVRDVEDATRKYRLLK
jgi:hypothetical protein